MNGLRALATLVAGVAIATVASAALAASPSEPPDASGAAAPPSDAVKEAEAHFRRGVDLYKDNDSGGALVEFKRAYDLAPNYRVLFNLGQTYFQLQRYADALKTLQAFLAQGGAQIAADRRAAVEADVRQLENRVGQVEVRTNVDGAQLLVDDEAAGVAPLAQAVAVSVGHRKIAAMRPGLPTQERYVDIAAGDHVTVVLDFPATPLALAGTPAPALTPTPAPARTGPWIAWGVTAAFGAATVVTGVLALAAKSDLSTQLDTFPGNPGAIDSARTRTKTFAVASDALLGATVIAGGVAVYVTLAGSSRAPTEVGIGPRGLQLRGRY